MGLGAFTVIGVQLAFEQAKQPTFFLLVFVGVLTGVGGGVSSIFFNLDRSVRGVTQVCFFQLLKSSENLSGVCGEC